MHPPAGEQCVAPGYTLVVDARDGGLAGSMTPASPYCGVTGATVTATRGDAGECVLSAQRTSGCTFSGEAQCEDIDLTLTACADGTATGTLRYRQCWCGGSNWPALRTMSVTAELR